MNPGSRPYQDIDTFRGLKTPFRPSPNNTFSTDLSSHVAVLVFAVYPVAGRSLRRLSIIAHPLQTPGKQAFGLTHNTSSLYSVGCFVDIEACSAPMAILHRLFDQSVLRVGIDFDTTFGTVQISW